MEIIDKLNKMNFGKDGLSIVIENRYRKIKERDNEK